MSKGFYDDVTQLEIIADEECTCKGNPENGCCRGCVARQSLDEIYELVKKLLEVIKSGREDDCGCTPDCGCHTEK